MTAAVLLVAVAVLLWPGGAAGARLRALGDPESGAHGGRGRGGAAAHPSGASAARTPGVVSRVGALGGLVLRVPAGVLWPLVGAVVGLLGAGPLHACAGGVLGGVAADLHARAGGRRDRLTRLGAWERALDDAASALRAGADPGAALGRAAEAAAAHDAQVAALLAAAGSHARLGGDVTAALRPVPAGMTPAGTAPTCMTPAGTAPGADPIGAAAASGSRGDRVPGELAGAWLLATRHGVELAEVVDGLRADVASRRERAVRVHATLAGPRATAVILTALPALGVLLGSGFGADPLGVLLGGALGGALCLAGAVLLAAGLLWTDRIAGGADR
ncbi:MAG: type II secretion system F family protein [Dietzia sp.]